VRVAPRRRRPGAGILVRLFIYVLAAILFFVFRARVDWKQFAHRTTSSGVPDTTLVLAGADVAPLLVDTMVRRYRQDYPRLRIDIRGGTTAQALQDLIDTRADAVFLARPPSSGDQAGFTRATGDSAIWFPIALGAVLVVSAPDQADTVVSLETLRRFGSGKAGIGRRLYVPDPNSGLWWAFLARLGLPDAPSPSGTPPGVVFLKDDDTVLTAVLSDVGSIGIVSSFALRKALSVWGVQALAIQTESGTPSVMADNVSLSTGNYPLWCYLYASCRAYGDIRGSMFITYVTGPRGQRQIDSTPYLPAKIVSREVLLRRIPTKP
jgi:DNA-binding transcriptional LysR family regulator